jgi:small-conductance mechanosensitive channel
MLVAMTLSLFLLFLGLKKILCLKVGGLIKRPNNSWDTVCVATVERTGHFFLIVAAFYTAYVMMGADRKYELHADRTFFVVLMVQITIWLNFLINRGISSSILKRTRRNPAAASSISLIQLLSKLVLISTVILFTLNNMGIKITTILAGLSVGGLAVALAVQKILGDLFSSLSIVMDKPFMVGDFIIVNEFMGEVEKIGLRTTHLRSLSGEQIILSNSDLLGSRIRNYQRMHERRVVFQIPLAPKTEPAKLKMAVNLMKSIVMKHEGVRFERCHFMDITRESMKIETVYWSLSPDYLIYLDHHQSILLEVYQALTFEGILIASPILPLSPPLAEMIKPDFPVTPLEKNVFQS